MTKITKIDENIKGDDNFRAWKYKIMLILEEHDLEGYIKYEFKELEGDEEKAKNKKDVIKVKMINLIPSRIS